MSLKKASSHRAAGKKGVNRKTAPRQFFSAQKIRSSGQRSHLKNKPVKSRTWK